MNGFQKFLVGLGLFSILAFMCINKHRHEFAFPDASVIQSKLGSIGFPGLTASAHEGTVTLTGEVPTEEARTKAEMEVKALDGIDTVINQITVNDGPGEFAARFVRHGESVVLRGTLPDQATKDGVVMESTALWGEGNVTDELVVAGVNAAPELLPSIKGMLPRVKELQGGKLVVNREEFHLYGRSPDPGLSRALSDQYKPTVPEDTKLGVHIGAPWTRNSLMGIARAHDGNVVLSGVVPDWDTHDKLLGMAQKEWGEDHVVNRMQIAGLDNEPKIIEGFEKLVPSLKGVDGGQLMVSPEEAIFSGYMDPESDEGKSFKEKLGGMWPGLKFDLGPKFATADCQTAVNAILAKDKIQFETDSDAIKVESDKLLREVASTLRRCPESSIEIQGHTDADGDDAYNQDLSQRRADSVRVRLLSLGMPTERASTKGFGETSPIADNNTEEGKQKNRRIEFKLKGNEQ